MAGKLCPECGKRTFFQSNSGRACTKCGFEMIVPVNNGKGGKGKKCPNCDKHTLFDGKCSTCGAMFKKSKAN